MVIYFIASAFICKPASLLVPNSCYFGTLTTQQNVIPCVGNQHSICFTLHRQCTNKGT